MWYVCEGDTIVVHVYVQPGAKRTEIVGFFGNALKIRLASPPIDGRANVALVKFIAKLFDVPIRQIEFKRGDKSRYKTIAIRGSAIEPSSII